MAKKTAPQEGMFGDQFPVNARERKAIAAKNAPKEKAHARTRRKRTKAKAEPAATAPTE